MPGVVIQGFFIGGGMCQRSAGPSIRQAPARPGPPPALGPRSNALPPGAPVQPFGAQGSVTLDPAAIGLAQGGGRPLPGAILAKMEAAFGADFSAVRVHIGPQPGRIGALAFTTGNDIYFANGQFQPDTVRGQRLIGHELAHVIQQRQGRVHGAAQGVTVVQDRLLEAEADRMGWRAAVHRAGTIQRATSHAGGSASPLKVVQRTKRKAGAMLAPVGPVVVPVVPLVAPARRMVRVQRGAVLSTNGYFTRTTGPCGGMRYVARFTLRIPQNISNDGFILQRITRTFRVRLTTAAADMAAGAIDTYVALNPGSAAHATETTYWEVWPVVAGVIGHNGDDEFTICSFVDATPAPHLDTTKGSYEIRGSATYYACTAGERATFIAGLANPAQCAGILASTTNNPAAALLPAWTTSNTLDRQVTSTWDSTDNGAGAVIQDTTIATA